MTRHDVPLWSFAHGELELGEQRFVQAHLEDCPDCADQLEAIRLAREALALAREATPALGWARTDERIGAMVEKQLARQARGPLYRRLGWGGLGLALAGAAALVALWPRPAPAPLPEIDGTVPVSSWARVERAEGLSRVGGEKGLVADGTELHGGDVIRTSVVGKAFVHLPDQSHVRVGAGSQLALTRTESDDVALTLERGALAVRASHQPRKSFVVHTGGVSVQVLGTVFGVTNDADLVEVSVSEGRVRVELPDGAQALVDPGQRLRFDTRSQKVKHLKLSASMEKQLAEVLAADEAATAVELNAAVPAVGGAPSVPPMVVAQGTPRSLPRLSAQEARARQVTAPAMPAPVESPVVQAPEAPPPSVAPVVEKKPDVVLEAPADVWPSLGGGEVVRGVPERREPQPASAPEEWSAPPVHDATEWRELPAPAARVEAPAPVSPKPAARDLEAIFLSRAEESVAAGTCERFLLGLEEIALDESKSARSEQARVLRARCFDAQMRPRQAMGEYRKYLELHPQGRFAPEARQALGE